VDREAGPSNRGRRSQLTGSEIATVRQGTTLVVSAAQGIIAVYRANRTVSKRDLQLLRVYSEKTVALARINAAGELSQANLQQIIDTSRVIESLPPGSISLPFAMDQLEHLNRKLRSILDAF
jgi:hypothetical protein